MADSSTASRAVRLECVDEGAVRIVLDQPDKSANVLSRGFQDSLALALDELEAMQGVDAVILWSAKPRIFVAGADLNAIVDSLDWSAEQIIEFCHHGRRLYHRLQQGPWTSVAAIQGACVGGGLELALGCDYRVAADEPRPLFGLPETRLGLIPGWAGTVRLPRMMELDQAIDLIAGSRLFPASTTLQYGLVDEVVAAERLLEAALQLSRDPARRAARDARRREQLGPARTTVDDVEAACRRWSQRVRADRSVWYFAPELLAHHMIRSADQDFEAACLSEARTMAAVWGSPASRGLLNVHFLAEHNRRSPGRDVDPRLAGNVRRVGVAGCGWMGGAIARLAHKRGAELILFDRNQTAAERVAADCGASARVVQSLPEFAGCELVLECVSERDEDKLPVLSELSRATGPDAVIATNTSTIPVRKLASAVEAPERFCGIHFCHPGLLDLVEIVPGPSSVDRTLSTALQWVRGLGKSPVVVRDQPGFVVNRLLQALVDSALGLFVRGTPMAAIDQAMEDAGAAGGPFLMMDEIGIDTLVLGGKNMASLGGSGTTAPPALLPRMVRNGRLGRKCGRGFYLWPEGERPRLDDEAGRLLADFRAGEESGSHSGGDGLLQELLLPVMVTATELIDDGAVADPRDIDFCLLKGLGFPPILGGILFWADTRGPAAIARALESRPPVQRGRIPAALSAWLGAGRFFYPHGTRTGPDNARGNRT